MIMIRELFKLDFRTSILFSNNSRIWFNDLLYIRIREGKVKSYTVLKLHAISYSDGYEEYHLSDENANVCAVDRERIFIYRGQNLKIQRVYDITTQTLSIVLITVLLSLPKIFPKMLEYLLG